MKNKSFAQRCSRSCGKRTSSLRSSSSTTILRTESGAIADRVADADPRVKVIHDPALSPGWLGKCNAMQKGMSMSSADVLLFMDADIEHHPRCFITALAEMERLELDFLSLFPRIRCISLWENAILPSLIGAIALFATPAIEDSESPDALAAGTF